MASGPQSTSQAKTDVLERIIGNLGATVPASGGEGELLSAIATAILGFVPPDGIDSFLGPLNSTAQTFDRRTITTVTATSASGVKNMTAVFLPKNTIVNNLNMVTGTTAAITPTHQWMGLYDNTRKLLAISADGLTAAMAGSTALVYPIANTAAGAATSFVTTYTGLYYIGVVVVAGTQPTWSGVTGTVANNTQPPIVAGTSDTGLTVPETFPTTAAVITPTAQALYAYTT